MKITCHAVYNIDHGWAKKETLCMHNSIYRQWVVQVDIEVTIKVIGDLQTLGSVSRTHLLY